MAVMTRWVACAFVEWLSSPASVIFLATTYLTLDEQSRPPQDCQLQRIRLARSFGNDPTSVPLALPDALQHILLRPLEGMQTADQRSCHGQEPRVPSLLDGRLMTKEFDGQQLAQVGPSFVERGRGEGAIALAEELEANEEEDVDDGRIVHLGKVGLQRLNDGELDLGAGEM